MLPRLENGRLEPSRPPVRRGETVWSLAEYLTHWGPAILRVRGTAGKPEYCQWEPPVALPGAALPSGWWVPRRRQCRSGPRSPCRLSGAANDGKHGGFLPAGDREAVAWGPCREASP